MTADELLRAELAKPFDADPREDGCVYCDDEFDPWSLFPAIYGTYSSEFDELALDVLRDIQSGVINRDDLASEIFREMLCTGGFCDYGSSPRVCFWALDKHLLAQLIARWEVWRSRR